MSRLRLRSSYATRYKDIERLRYFLLEFGISHSLVVKRSLDVRFHHEEGFVGQKIPSETAGSKRCWYIYYKPERYNCL